MKKFAIYIIKLKDVFAKAFKAYPKSAFNLIYFGVVTVILCMFYNQFHAKNLSDEKYVQKKISEMSDANKLDTLIRLIHGDEITIRDFPYIKSYSVSYKNAIKDYNNYTRFYYLTSIKDLSFFPLSADKYLIKYRNGDWKKDSITNNVFDYRIIAGMPLPFNYDDDGLSIIISKKRPVSSSVVNYLSLEAFSRRAVQDSVVLPDTFKSHLLRQMAYSYSISTDRIYLRDQVRQSRGSNNKYTNYEKILPINIYDDEKPITNSFSVDTSFLKVTLNVASESIYYLRPVKQTKNVNIQYDIMRFSISDSTAKALSHLNKNTYVDRFITDQKNEYFMAADNGRLKIYDLTNDKGSDSSKNRIMYYKLQHDSSELETISSDAFNNNLWLMIKYKNANNYELVKIKLNEETGRQDFKIANILNRGLLQLNKEKAVCYFLTDENTPYFIKTDGRLIEYPNAIDSVFLNKIKGARVYIPKYGGENEYIANYYDGLAEVVITKNKNEYSYKFVNNINWLNDTLNVTPTIDTFYAIIIVAFMVSAYFILYFLFRGYFNEDRILIDYTDSIFKNMPLLSTKIQILQNDMNQLKLRSDYMLALGITLGAGGVLASIITFQATESTIGNSWGNPHTFLGIFRPVILLAFIEMFTFYFLKQYRIIFNEYKRFYSLFFNLSAYFNVVEISNNNKFSGDTRSSLIKKMNDQSVALHENNTMKQIDEFDHDSILKLVEAMDKFKK